MNKQLALRKNDAITGQYAKNIVKAVLDEISKRHRKDIGLFNEELPKLNIPGVIYLTTSIMVSLDYGWLMYKSIADTYKNKGKTLQGILKGKSNTKNWDRSINVKCPVEKGRTLILIELHLKDDYKPNFLVIDDYGKIIPCQYAALYSHNWDEESPKVLQKYGLLSRKQQLSLRHETEQQTRKENSKERFHRTRRHGRAVSQACCS